MRRSYDELGAGLWLAAHPWTKLAVHMMRLLHNLWTWIKGPHEFGTWQDEEDD